ncbi:MAG: Eco57I restriction-modification methylase domain-containing protein, partial [Candidatus Thorarchaeota archaeon]
SVKRLIYAGLKRNSVKSISSLTSRDAINLLNEIQDSIYGIDINPIACILCQINILFSVFDLIKLIISYKSEYQIPFFHIVKKNALELTFENKYDYVVGNPPYLFIRNISRDQKQLIKKRNFVTNTGQYDYYQLFIEIGINLLKDEGYLGFIIPDSILTLSNRKKLRKFIYEQTLIKEISSVGSQFKDPNVANVILILRRSNDLLKRNKNVINVNVEAAAGVRSTKLLQNMIKTWDYNFLINLNQKDVEIIYYLNNSFTNLGELIKNTQYKILISRGVELTKSGKVIYCNNCKSYFPYPKGNLVCRKCSSNLSKNNIEKIVVNTIPENSRDVYFPFIFTINRYKIKGKKFIELNKPGINYKNPEIYQNRIVIRQLNERNLICATYDDLSYTSQSLYNLKIIKSPIEQFNNHYLLGLINSDLLSYYFIKSFGSYKTLFPRILIEKIKSLPIKIPLTEIEVKKSVLLQNHIASILDSYQKEYKPSMDFEVRVNSLVYDLYYIDRKTREYISSFFLNV